MFSQIVTEVLGQDVSLGLDSPAFDSYACALPFSRVGHLIEANNNQPVATIWESLHLRKTSVNLLTGYLR